MFAVRELRVSELVLFLPGLRYILLFATRL